MTGWSIAYWLLWIGFFVAAALNLLRVRAGFLTNYLADLVVPALLYVISRGLVPRKRKAPFVVQWLGRTPERAASVLFLASAVTEWSQRYWPQGPFAGRYDPADIVAFGLGVSTCYICDRYSGRASRSNTGA